MISEGRIKSGLRKVRFEGGGLPYTPENAMSPDVNTPGEINILVIDRPENEELIKGEDMSDLDPSPEAEEDGGKKKGKKGKKDKKDKKDKKKKDKKKKKKK